MGEEIYAAAPPTGYPDRSSFWIGEGPFLSRVNLAWRASDGQYGFGPRVSSTGTTPSAIVNELSARLVHGGLSPISVSRLSDFAAQISAGSRARETAALILVCPESLVH